MRLKASSTEAVLLGLSDRGYHIMRGEELAAILADLNQLIDEHVPAQAGRNSLAYARSQELVRALDERLSRG
ncbi:hypothetical protein FHW19_004503 [Ochrobactrum anthropi]|uniref:hypothetical protein n=1 Tax=Brucella anthropi TaxID=529 RepID=UPI0015FC3877|nr:hypothetical protein [Brucella anthropi]MBA8862752.1 hypothetical protein [Brucella anthropi]